MNRLATLALVLAATLALPVAAAEAPAGHAVLVVSCTDGSRPSLGEVADFLGTNNSHQVYTARSRLMTQVRHECSRGNASQVALVGRQVPTLAASTSTKATRIARD